MPRIELIPENFDPKSGDGSPTIDVCFDCGDDLFEGDFYHHFEHGECEITSTEVAHPPYEECDYTCEICGDPLTSEDD